MPDWAYPVKNLKKGKKPPYYYSVSAFFFSHLLGRGRRLMESIHFTHTGRFFRMFLGRCRDAVRRLRESTRPLNLHSRLMALKHYIESAKRSPPTSAHVEKRNLAAALFGAIFHSRIRSPPRDRNCVTIGWFFIYVTAGYYSDGGAVSHLARTVAQPHPYSAPLISAP